MYAGVKVQCSVTMFLFWFSVSDIHYNIRLYDCGSNCQAITVLALFGFLYLYWLLTDFTYIFFSDRMHQIEKKKKNGKDILINLQFLLTLQKQKD